MTEINENEKSKKNGGGVGRFFISFAGAALACVLVCAGFYAFVLNGSGGSSQDSESSTDSQTTLGSSSNTSVTVDENSTLAEAVSAKALPSVCSIDVYTYEQSQNSFFGFGYNNNSSSEQELTESSLGSGVILSEDGYILTNEHVVEDGAKFVVTIEGAEYDAELVGTDASSDLAVLKVVDGEGFTPIEIGDSDNLTIGEWVMTIGSPFGLEQSVATGIVSATSRSSVLSSSSSQSYSGDSTTRLYVNLIQTDAAINPGNSGGALVDSNGQLIGINTLITSYSGNYSGVGFAIPANYAIKIAQSLIDGETPTHAKLGVTMVSITSSIAQRYDFDVDYGVYVSSVESGSAAADAGIQVGDIITAYDGEKIESSSDLMLAVRGDNPGDKVTITVHRDSEEIELTATLGADSSSESSSSIDGLNRN